MKKTFALVLAVAMVMSLAAVSFAAPTRTTSTVTAAAKAGKQNDMLSLTGPFRYDGDAHQMKSELIQYGKAAYWQIEYNGNPVTNYNDIEKLKIKTKWEMGSDLVESLKIVKKNVSSNYEYFVELKTKATATTSDSDIIGTLTFNMKKNKDATNPTWEFDDADIDLTLNVYFENSWLDSAASYVIGKNTVSPVFKPDTKYLLKFDSDGEEDLEFGLEQNEGTFTVDVSGQGKVVLEFNTTANDAIVAANPGAKMFFVNFNNVKFNRTGEFAYESETFEYVYEIKDGKLVNIPSAEYDDADETIYFNTRTLGAYVFSDVELVDAVVDAPVVTAPVETNPSTGAAA